MASFIKLIVMATYNLSINGKTYKVEADPKMPLLWVIRDLAGLHGTKYGCGMAQCGACTVHINGNPVRSCTLPVASAAKQTITTIEGLSADNTHAVQKSMVSRTGSSMWLLPKRTNNGCGRLIEKKSKSD